MKGCCCILEIQSLSDRCGLYMLKVYWIQRGRVVWFLVFLLVTNTIAVGATPEKRVYTQTSNRELKQKSLQLVKRIRDLVYSYNKTDQELLAEYNGRDRVASTSGAEKVARQQWLKNTDTLHDSTMKRYKEQYWSDAILLADEILRRLPKQKPQANVLLIYQQPTNVLGVQTIADHLELIAKSLPD
jgi:hypothetical protein